MRTQTDHAHACYSFTFVIVLAGPSLLANGPMFAVIVMSHSFARSMPPYLVEKISYLTQVKLRITNMILKIFNFPI